MSLLPVRVATYEGQVNNGPCLSAKPCTAQVHLTMSTVCLQPYPMVISPVPEYKIGIDIPRV